MDKILNPDTGLMFWTIITFLCLVFILGKFAWGPLLSAIEEREKRMKDDLAGAKKAREDAENIRKDVEGKLAGIASKTKEILDQATRDAEALRHKLKAEAEADAGKIRDKTMAELDEEKQRLVRELRKEVAGLSMLAAERLVRRSIDADVQKSVMESFLKDIEKGGRPK